MKREILVNVTPKETRVAILEDEQLCELLVDREEEERHVGDIYKGLVTAVLPGMQSAFVDIGLERDAFLYVGEVIDPIPSSSTCREGSFFAKLARIVEHNQGEIVFLQSSSRGYPLFLINPRLGLI